MTPQDPQVIQADAEQRMDGAVTHIQRELSGVRTGRASINILDNVTVEAYGAEMPLNQVVSLSVPESTLIVASPFDPSQITAIEKAIRNANLGLNPSNDGRVIRIPIPTLTDERRQEMSRLAGIPFDRSAATRMTLSKRCLKITNFQKTMNAAHSMRSRR